MVLLSKRLDNIILITGLPYNNTVTSGQSGVSPNFSGDCEDTPDIRDDSDHSNGSVCEFEVDISCPSTCSTKCTVYQQDNTKCICGDLIQKEILQRIKEVNS
jgi:hypothetical protein